MLPVDHIPHLDKASIQRAAGVDSPVVGRHHVAFLHGIFQTQFNGIHVQLCCQFIGCGFDCKQALCGTIAAVGTGRHVICINHIADKAESLRFAVQRDGLVSGQSHCRGAMLTVGTGIGQCVQIYAFHDAILCGAHPDMDLHFMAGRGCDLAFQTAENDLGRLFCLPCHECRIHFTDRRLLCAKAAADAGLGNANHGLWNVQRIGNVAPCVEHDLGRAEHIQASIGVNRAIGAEGLHHCLLAGFGMVYMIDHDITACQNSFDIAGAALIMGAEVALVVCPHRTQAFPVLLRVDKHRVILGGVVVQNRFQHLIFHLDELERLIHAFFVLAGHNGHHVAHKADMPVNDQTVIRAGFRIGLTRLRITAGVLVYIFPRVDCFDTGHFFCCSSVDGFDDGVRVRRTQQLDDQAVLRDHIVHIDRLTGDQLHGVFLPKRFVDSLHSAASFCFFHARKFMMPRSCPS